MRLQQLAPVVARLRKAQGATNYGIFEKGDTIPSIDHGGKNGALL